MSAWSKAAASGGSLAKKIEASLKSAPAAAEEGRDAGEATPAGPTLPLPHEASSGSHSAAPSGSSGMGVAGGPLPSGAPGASSGSASEAAPSSGAAAAGGGGGEGGEQGKSKRKGEHWNILSEAVQLIICEWPILRTALQQRSAGAKTQERFDAMLDMLLENLVEVWDDGDDLSYLSVLDYLEEVLDTDLNIDFDGDGQLIAVSRQIERLFNLCAKGSTEAAQGLIKAFEERMEAEAEESMRGGGGGGAIRAADGEDDGDDEDDGDEDEGEDDGWQRPKGSSVAAGGGGGGGDGGEGGGDGSPAARDGAGPASTAPVQAPPSSAAAAPAGAGEGKAAAAAPASGDGKGKGEGEGEGSSDDDDGWRVVGQGRKGR